MHMQAPTLTTTNRQPLFVTVAALVVAAIVAGVLVLATRDDSSTSAIAPAKPASAQSTDTRVLDGSPLLRGAAAAPAVTVTSQSGLARVWDGTPILRGSSAVPHSGGGPSAARLGAPTSSLAGTTSSQSQSQPQFPVRPPEGFHRAP
jgi:hypothetical protein